MPESHKSHYASGEQIELAPPSADWAGLFLREKSLLERMLHPNGLVQLEHVGSTAIPGIIAKPIVDIVAGMGPAYRVASIKRTPEGRRLTHLHVVPANSDFFRNIVTFRDALRHDALLARDYESLKLRLLASATDRLDYRDGKGAFVAATLERFARG